MIIIFIDIGELCMFMCVHVCREVMSTPAVVMRTVENIGRIMNILADDEDSHNGFPVVEDYDPDNMEGVRQPVRSMYNIFTHICICKYINYLDL